MGNLKNANPPAQLRHIKPTVGVQGQISGSIEIPRPGASVAKLQLKLEVLIKDEDGTFQFIGHIVVALVVSYYASHIIELSRSATGPAELYILPIRGEYEGCELDRDGKKYVPLRINAESVYVRSVPFVFFNADESAEIITILVKAVCVCHCNLETV